MKFERSPWIEQLPPRRATHLGSDIVCDTVVIGAGIAGVATSYYLLKDTSRRVVLLEAGRLAHGATGHNAGQIASYFERPFAELVEEFGLEMAAQAQLDLLSAWDMLDRILDRACVKNRPLSFAGYAGCTTVEQLLSHLRNHSLRAKDHISMDFAYVLNDPKILRRIPAEYEPFYSAVPLAEIQEKLETSSAEYIAVLTSRKGCMNSALFCHEVVEFLEQDSRFALYEHTPVSHISIVGDGIIVTAGGHIVQAKEVILCTNGYALPALTAGEHPAISGDVGRMGAYVQRGAGKPFALSYFSKSPSYEDPYFYATRRPRTARSTLVCVGGPERILRPGEQYDPEKEYLRAEARQSLAFVQRMYANAPKRFSYNWEGLMGYTAKGVRIVGRHPQVPQVLYNLGCNGVGILSAIYGAKRLSLLLQGKHLEPSIFDPALQIPQAKEMQQ